MTQNQQCDSKRLTKQTATYLSYALIALMLCQSFLVMCKTFDLHDVASTMHSFEYHHQHQQIPTEHTQLHQHETSTSDEVKKLYSHDDCHQCGQCHGSHVQWLSQSVTTKAVKSDQSHTFYYLIALLNALPDRKSVV